MLLRSRLLGARVQITIARPHASSIAARPLARNVRMRSDAAPRDGTAGRVENPQPTLTVEELKNRKRPEWMDEIIAERKAKGRKPKPSMLDYFKNNSDKVRQAVVDILLVTIILGMSVQIASKEVRAAARAILWE